MRYLSRISSIIAILASGFAAGCAPAAKAPKPLTLSVPVPKVEVLEQGKETQERGGVTVQVAPPLFSAERSVRRSCVKVPSLVVLNGQESYEIQEEPAFYARPENLMFVVKVTNHTTKVLKLAGTLFRFLVEGKEVTLDAGPTTEFGNGVLRPNDTKDFTILGPSWGSLPEKATIGLSMFDLPTAFDDAGNVTKKENFDWTFAFEVTEVSKTDQVKTQTVSMTPAEAAAACPDLSGVAAQ